MNVQDTKAPSVEGDRLEAIFQRQAELMHKYVEIERESGVGKALLPPRFDLDDPRCQYVLKDFAWRVTEELAEACDALTDPLHFQEEVADGLHFLVELALIAGLFPEDVAPKPLVGDRLSAMAEGLQVDHSSPASRPTEVFLASFLVVKSLGLAMNCLKNKPWKQSHVETDAKKFRAQILATFWHYVALACACGLGADGLFDLYFRKAAVNSFRQDTKY